jgi:hypothetical protein
MKKTLLTISIVFTATFAFGQGCSDAGICSIGHAFQSTETAVKNTVEIATIFGAGDGNVTYFSPYVSYSRQINDRFALSTKITFSSAKGDFGTLSSFGDAFIVGNYTFKYEKLSALIGGKIPLNNSNLKINGISMPLEYQSSLGTYDLFLGTNYKYNKFDFNVAVQIPVINNNKNTYYKNTIGNDPFSSTNLFERKSDALFRTTYTINTTNQKFTFKPNVLFIYHLGDDSFVNPAGNRVPLVGSKGLTINGNLIGTYNISAQKSIELSIASPFVIRTIRPDGLTRSFVLGILYKYSF